MKICVIGNPNTVHIRRWIEYLISKRYSVHWIGEHTPIVRLPEGVIFHDLTKLTNIRKLRYLVWTARVNRILQSIKPDVVHAHGVVSAGWLGAAAGYHPFMVTAHGSDLILLDQRSGIYRMLTRWVLRRADYVTCVSKYLATRAKALGAKPDHVEVVYLGVDLEVFHPPARQELIRRRLHLGEGPLVLSIRAMKPTYHLLDLAKAIPSVLEHVPQVCFLVFTYNIDQGYLSRFREILSEQIASGAVRFVEALKDDQAIAEYYQACDIAISVPSSDGTPKSVQEAMACGIPVVVSDVPGLHEWIANGKEGLFVPVGDIYAISQAIIQLLLDERLRRQMGRNAFEKIRRQADLRHWSQRAEEIYIELAGQKMNL